MTPAQKTLIILAFCAGFSISPWVAEATGALLNRPNQVVVSGNYAYIVSDLSNSLEIIDISNPTFPTHAGAVANGDPGVELFAPKSVDVSGNYAYVVSYSNNLVIFDVSDPENPVHLSTLQNGNNGAQLIRPVLIKVSDNYAYIAVNGGQNISIVDISDPSNPTSVSVIPSSGWFASPTSLFVSNSYLYFTEIHQGGSGALKIYDVSDPSTPVSKGAIYHGTDGASIDNPTSVFVKDNFVYVTSYGGRSLEIIDVSDPAAPTHAGVIYDGDGGANLFVPFSVKVIGNYAYMVTFQGSGLEVVDISDPANPTHVGKIDNGEGGAILYYNNSLDVSGNYAYVASFLGNALEVVDISDSANPVHAGVLRNGEIGGPPTQEVCAENCFSNVLFLPGIKGSVLEKGSDIIWPPDVLSNDVPQLALTDSGESVNDVHVAGVLGSLALIIDVYSPFADFMDSITGEGKLINEWLPLGYDWRFSPEKILEDGIKTREGVINVIQRIEELAANSRTGRVTIVAHSMGGLLGKAIIKELEAEGEDDLIDSFVMVGTPQLGTPQAIASMLHGDSEGVLKGFVVNPAKIRAVAQNMPSGYELLPSEEYFQDVSDPVITFDTDSPFTQAWRNVFGDRINAFTNYFSFLIGGGVARDNPAENDLRSPEVLNGDLLLTARNSHRDLDNYQFPDHIRVVQVAGWGSPTTKAVNYALNHNTPGFTTDITREGDGTVVYSSAVSSSADETYFFNIFDYNEFSQTNSKHKDLLNTSSIQNLIESVVKNVTVATSFISNGKPSPSNLEDQLIVTIHSPIILGAYDQHGNFTGIDPRQDLSADILDIKEEIPSSTFSYTSDSQSIFLPKNGIYNFIYKGIGSGPTTVKIDNFSSDNITHIASFTDIPTSQNTAASFDVDSSTPQNTIVEVDQDGDGQVDQNVMPDGTQPAEPSLNELLTLLRTNIQNLTATDKIKQNLLRKIDNLEQKIVKKKIQNAKILAKFEDNISKKTLRGKIDIVTAASIVELLDLLQAQSDNITLDTGLLTDLRAKIQQLNLKPNQKNDLLKRIDRLENKQRITLVLANFTANIQKKGSKGKLTDAEAQELINILTQIESVI